MASMSVPPLATLQALEGLILDCDGVLTPGDLYYDQSGNRLLRFSSKDGLGLACLCRSDFPVAVLSGRPTDIAELRLRELGVRAFKGACRNKAEGVRDLCQTLGITPAQVAFMGDDLPDLAGFAAAGLAIAPADAAAEVRETAAWVTSAGGGRGAVREVCEAILKAKGLWQGWLNKFSGRPP